ncbi:MAG: hypothetical protein ACRC33_02005 [Gemmataceae bacterium]
MGPAPLSQGDIFTALPMPVLSFRAGVHLVQQGAGLFEARRTDGAVEDGMNVLAGVQLVDAIVIEQSCDTLRADLALLAPLRDCDLSKKKKAKDIWEHIKTIGSSLAQPSRAYQANDPEFRFPRRYIDLSAKFSLAPEDLAHFIGLNLRVATLTDRGLINLQHRLTVQLSRVAREDLDWLSDDDLAIKAEALTVDVEAKGKALATKRGQMNSPKIQPEEREALEADIEVTEEQKKHLEAELAMTRECLTRVLAAG